MVNPFVVLLGPLVGPECLRATARGWLVLVRTLAALAIVGATLLILWWWWFSALANPAYQPYSALRVGLVIVEGMMITVSLVLTPAVLAGSLAGERERGALGLLLTTRVSSREIVSARMAGKLTQVAMILLAGVPALVLLAALAGMELGVVVALLALPAAVAIGGGGLATAISAVSRRGRDALLTVYLVDVLCLLSPLAGRLGYSSPFLDWFDTLNPYAPLTYLVWSEYTTPALISIGLWLAIGLAGLVLATWRLAPTSMRQLDGGRIGKLGRRRGRIPPLDHRPMLWKELYIERVGSLGGFGWWLGAVLTLLMAGGSVCMAGLIAWDVARGGEFVWFEWAKNILEVGVGGSGRFVGWLIEWAIGLRAAVTIASERERGSWDAILTSPLEGREIIGAKLWGCLYALRWLFASALLAWTIAAAAGALPLNNYIAWVVGTIAGGIFMAAVGVRSSLACATATRAMAVTIGIWLGAQVAFYAIAGIIFVTVGATMMLSSSAIYGPGPAAAPLIMAIWTGPVLKVTWLVSLNGTFLVAALLIVSSTRVLFDRLAGRRTGGRAAVAIDLMVYGSPVKPVLDPDFAPVLAAPAETKETAATPQHLG